MAAPARVNPAQWSLLQLLKPEVLADPYPFYARLRGFEPVHWDAYLHSWVVTSYAESVVALAKFKANRTPTPEALAARGLEELQPYAELLLKQLMFLDGPQHTRLRGLCAVAFTPKRVERLRGLIGEVAEDLLDRALTEAGDGPRGHMEVVEAFAAELPGFAMTALLGLPRADHAWLKRLANSLAELIGNFNHEPERLRASVESLKELQEYLQVAIDERRKAPGEDHEGLIAALLAAEMNRARLTDEEVIANVILILVGGLEETTNLISGGMLSLLRHPAALVELRERPEIAGTAVEELLRFESPTQHTGRVAPEDVTLGGKSIRAGDSVTIVLAAANRDPERFDEPERLDLWRGENRHLAFGYAAHYCMGAPLTRMTAQIALTTLLRRLPGLALAEKPVWRRNMGLRGLESLRMSFDVPGTQHMGTVQEHG